MAYQVLARKSRPQDFASLIGQEAIVTALHNGLSEGRIANAYLFSGIRGVGKTSAARVLAKALNCEAGPTPDPCNECRICQEITRGGDLDVIEVDAATYSKVEQVRELTESLRYGPARDRYKVVILDEVHRLSRQAFDALLKIVEEPPPHLVFIFATTEIEAVPATILSRCQEFRFRRVSSQVLAAHLRKVSDQEGLEVSDSSLRLIARAGDGSVRDSVALLDQLATFGAGTIADAEASRLLGGLDTGLFRGVLESILLGDSKAIVETVRQLEGDGRDPRHVFSQFLSYCRDALHLSLEGQREHLELPEEDCRELATLLERATYEDLLRLNHILLSSEAAVRRSDAGVLALEIAWLRAAELPKLTGIEEVLQGRGPGPSTGGGRRPRGPGESSEGRDAAAAATGRRRPENRTPPEAEPRRRAAEASQRPSGEEPRASSPPEPPPDLPPPEPPPDLPPPDLVEASPAPSKKGTVQELFTIVGRKKQPFLVRLRKAQALDAEGGKLTITGDPSLAKALERESNRRVLDEAVRETWGSSATWSFRETATTTPPQRPEPENPPAPEVPEEASQDPRVQQVLDIFGGTVERVVQHHDSQD